MKKLEDNVALITGGSRRIGACTARYLHSKGMRIILHYHRSSVDAENLQTELCEIRPNSVVLIPGDLKRISEMKYLVRESVHKLGRLDALVNNASAFYPTPLATATEDQWQAIMETNLMAPYFISQAAAPYLAKNKGVIIHMTDIYAGRPLPGHSIYAASKAGLVSLTKSLAQELGPDIRVNAVAPGAILWPEHATDELSQQRMISRTPLKRAGEPEDIAKTIYFLIAGSQYISGQVIRVDGGRTTVP